MNGTKNYRHALELTLSHCDDPLLKNSISDGTNTNDTNSNETNNYTSSNDNKSKDIRRLDGKVSWFVCVCCMLANVIVTGCVYVYGILFPYLLEEFQRGKTKTAFIASLAMGFYSLLAPSAAKISLRYGCRVAIVTGGLLSSVGFLGSSFAPHLYVLYLTFGVTVGFAATLIFMSGLQILSMYFDKQRYMATCTLTVGPGLGVLVMSPIVQALVDRLGWRAAMRILAGINLMTCLLGCTICRKNIEILITDPLKKKGLCSYIRSIDVSFFKDITFIILSLSIITTQLGDQLPYFHLAKYSAEIGIPGHRSSWFYFANGIAGMVFRLSTGKILDCGVSPLRLYQISAIVYAAITSIVPSVKNYVMVLIYAVTNGTCYGLIASSINCLIAKNYTGVKLGWFYFFQFIPGLISPTLAGFISDKTGSYHPVFYTSASILLLSVFFVQTTYWIKPTAQTLREHREMIVVEKETVL